MSENKYELTPPQQADLVSALKSGDDIYRANGIEYHSKFLGPDIVYVQPVINGSPTTWQIGIMLPNLPRLVREYEEEQRRVLREANKKTEIIKVKISAADKMLLDDAVQELGSNMSDFIRTAIHEKIERMTD